MTTMTKRTGLFKFLTTLLVFGLAACGGSGGGGGGGGATIPTATNSPITPPPTTSVAITTSGGATSSANQGIAANAFQAGGGSLNNASTLVGAVQPDNGGTQAKRETLGAIVRRHSEKLKDHQIEKLKDPSSATSAVQVETRPCTGGGTITSAFDDVGQSAIQVWVNCIEGGSVTHGTISSSNIKFSQDLGSTPGSTYSISLAADFTIDLSISTTSPVSTFVMQGSFTFATAFSGTMQAAPTGGVEQGPTTRVAISIGGASLLTSNGTVRERLSNSFSMTIDDNDTLGRTTTSGHYTYASTIIGGSVNVNISPDLVTQPQGGLHPSSGTVTITSSASLGKIVLTASPAGVTIDVYANAAGPVTDTGTLTWAQVDAL